VGVVGRAVAQTACTAASALPLPRLNTLLPPPCAAVGRPTVDNCLAGFHSTVFAYGQTGAGKTHTMHGQIGGGGAAVQLSGLAPRMFECLFERLKQEQVSAAE